jgi:tetracycline resistance efflux pump
LCIFPKHKTILFSKIKTTEMEYGWFSLLPPIVAIVLAITTRQVHLSLILGIFLGWLVLNDGNIWLGFLDTIQGFVAVFEDAGNTRTIMFSALVGALIVFIQRSGGVDGFILQVQKILTRYENKKSGNARVVVQLLAWLTGVLIFVESSVSSLTVGTLYRPVFDKLGIPREKLAFIADSTSAPASILIPFNGWGAFIMGLLLAEGFSNPFSTMFHAMAYNFYPMLALVLVLALIFTKKDFGPMATAEKRAREEGKLMADGAVPMIADELTSIEAKEGIPHRAMNMVLPIATMVVMMPVMLIYTGWEMAMTDMADASWLQKVSYAIGKGSGSTAVLVGVIISLLVSMALYSAQGIMKLNEMIDLTLKGISGLMPLALLMLFAFAIGNVCKSLETGNFVASVVGDWLPNGLIPFLIFTLSCFIAFATGTSWGTFGIMIPIAVPLAAALDVNVYMAIAAVMSGGVFGDHCSPISDTTILSSMASASDHIDHVRTQLPYALLSGIITAVLYIVLGFLM